MKKTLLATLLAIALVVSCFAGMSFTTASAADDYVIFADGKFEHGGEVQAESGTVIKDGALMGGEGMRDGVAGSGWFQIKIDDTMSAAAFEAYKYLVVDCEPVIEGGSTGMYNGGTVKFGEGSVKNFPDIEVNGKVGAKVAKRDTYVLDISGLTFDANWLLFTHCAIGYKIYSLKLTDDATGGSTGGNDGGNTGGSGGYDASVDYGIFIDGSFVKGGEVQAESGTVVKDGALMGGEGMRDGVAGSGWFQIKIDDTMSAAGYEAFKYLVVDCEPVIEGGSTGMYNGGTVKFGEGSVKNFPDIEYKGKVGAKIAKRDIYVLSLDGLTFDANWLLFTHCAIGYKIYNLWLTDDAERAYNGVGGGNVTPAPDDTTAAPAPDDTTAAPAPDDTTAAPAPDDTTAAPAPDDTTAAPAPDDTTAAPAPDDTTAAPDPTTPAPSNTTSAPVPGDTTAAPAPTNNVPATTAPSAANPGTGASGVAGAVAMSVLALAGFAVLSKKSK